MRKSSLFVLLFQLLSLHGFLVAAPNAKKPAPPPAPPQSVAFVKTILARELSPNERISTQALWRTLEHSDELLADWLRQDLADPTGLSLFTDDNPIANFRRAIAKVSGKPAESSETEDVSRFAADVAAYRLLCSQRRESQLAAAAAQTPRLVYARHFIMGGSHYAYTESLTDAQQERWFVPGGKLCHAEYTREGLWKETVLLDSPQGVIRDVDVDFDASRILFSWKKSDNEDDYHLYEIPVGDDGSPDPARIRQLTFGAGLADYEGCYLPDGSILFNSSRCQQIVDCWWTEVSNLYRCDADGSNIFRLTFDQVHDNYPTLTWDNRVLYTRWDYNDRSQMYPQPLFQMAPDGTSQAAVYGENSWFPTSIVHARAIPGSQNVFAIATGHHSRQPGELILIEPGKGRQETEGITRVAPIRPNPEQRPIIVDAYGQDGALFAYPYPIDSRSLFVSYNPEGWNGGATRRQKSGLGLYWMDIDGNRELLASRLGIACGRAVPLLPRKRPASRPSLVDYAKDEGTFHILDVYAGEAMRDVPRGTVKTLRVIELDFRVAGIRHNGNGGPGGGALVSTPISVGNGAWDVKIPLGDAKVHDDGSVFFKAPTRRPLYFVLLDEKGRMVQTMRSWTTLQPGENASCVGCHESKNSAPPAFSRPPKALIAGAQRLVPFWKERASASDPIPRSGFSFSRDVQPILDRHCVSCHDGASPAAGTPRPDFRGVAVQDRVGGRAWLRSYLSLTHAYIDEGGRGSWRGKDNNPVLNWVSAASAPTLQKPFSVGSSASKLFKRLDSGHGKTAITPAEVARLAAWVDMSVPFCGDYQEANIWTDTEKAKHAKYQAKRDTANAADAAVLQLLKSK
ncbi:MAG: hypothetical protein LBV54_01780 [Puniceicoccales bacterium]|jgi:hypothetical protein|nr:hypothetical protein [Puniceicoccales bacterium]